jgi:hypothetical protein
MSEEGKEPPLQLYLEVDGQEQPIELGESVTLQGTYVNPTVSLRASTTRRFADGLVEFDYPHYFVWEAKIDGRHDKTWNLTGVDFSIQYFIVPEQVTVGAFAKGLAKQLGSLRHARIQDTQRELGGVRYDGKTVHTATAGTPLVFELFVLPGPVAHTRILVFRDCPRGYDGISPEAEETYALLRRSFKDQARGLS